MLAPDARRSTLTPCDQLFTCVLSAYVAHTVCLSACVCHALRQFGDAKSLHTSLIVQMVDAQSSENCTTGRPRASGQLHSHREQQATEEVLVRSDHPVRGRAMKRLCLSCTSSIDRFPNYCLGVRLGKDLVAKGCYGPWRIIGSAEALPILCVRYLW